MTDERFPAYRFSISRMSVGLRVTLIACSSLPFVPFMLFYVANYPSADAGKSALALIAAVLFFVPAHEGMHGLAFLAFRRPVAFGWKPWTPLGPVFYATSTGSRFSRRQFQLACLAPQLLTALLALLAALPVADVVAIGAAYAAALNLGGGVVDIFVFALLQLFPRDAVFEDTKDGIDVRLPAENPGHMDSLPGWLPIRSI